MRAVHWFPDQVKLGQALEADLGLDFAESRHPREVEDPGKDLVKEPASYNKKNYGTKILRLF